MHGVGLQKSYCYIILEHIINEWQVVNMRSMAIHYENVVLLIIEQPQSSQMHKEHSSPIVEYLIIHVSFSCHPDSEVQWCITSP